MPDYADSRVDTIHAIGAHRLGVTAIAPSPGVFHHNGSDERDEVRVDGSATVYRLYDIGYTVDLDDAARLLGAGMRGRIRPRELEARSTKIHNPPLAATLSAFDLVIAGSPQRATICAHIFDFGVCSLQVSIPAPLNLTWPAFVEVSAAIDDAADLPVMFDRAIRDLVVRIGAAVERPALAPLAEEYTVYRIDQLSVGGGSAAGGARTTPFPTADALTDEDIAALLIGGRECLSRTARRELMPHRLSYCEHDLAVVTWGSALVVEPRVEDRDVEVILEFANAQLLELRMYDQQLDADLPALYDRAEAARARRIPRRAGDYRAVLSDQQTRLADITETIERVENVLTVTDDVYLARVYGAALDVFCAQAWRRGIDRKLAILRETYAALRGEAQAARAELLEIIIVVLILVELVLGLLHRASG